MTDAEPLYKRQIRHLEEQIAALTAEVERLREVLRSIREGLIWVEDADDFAWTGDPRAVVSADTFLAKSERRKP